MNKVKMRKASACIVWALSAALTASGESDTTIARRLVGSGLFVDAPGAAREERLYAERLSGYDTNRLARIAVDLSATNDMYVAAYMMRLVGLYGSDSHLPRLYVVLTNSELAASAMDSILRIEGVTSNSVVGLERCLSVNSADWLQMEVCREAIARFNAQQWSSAFSNQFSSCLVNSAMHNRKGCVTVDKILHKFDPTYKYSARRLRVLRSVYSLGVNEYQINYVTNAINELVAYPEANLPE